MPPPLLRAFDTTCHSYLLPVPWDFLRDSGAPYAAALRACILPACCLYSLCLCACSSIPIYTYPYNQTAYNACAGIVASMLYVHAAKQPPTLAPVVADGRRASFVALARVLLAFHGSSMAINNAGVRFGSAASLTTTLLTALVWRSMTAGIVLLRVCAAPVLPDLRVRGREPSLHSYCYFETCVPAALLVVRPIPAVRATRTDYIWTYCQRYSLLAFAFGAACRLRAQRDVHRAVPRDGARELNMLAATTATCCRRIAAPR